MAEKKKKDGLNELVFIQSNLKAPKSQRNNFGGYNYRSCEDIMEAVKPLLEETNCTLVISDEILQVSDRIYVKATATLKTPSGEIYQNSAYAREAQSKKGMDESQVTGAASSYARKYALNGLFCIDDNKDADSLNTSKEYTQQPAQQTQPQQPPQQQPMFTVAIQSEINACMDEQSLLGVWNKYPALWKDANFTGAVTARKDQVKQNGKS